MTPEREKAIRAQWANNDRAAIPALEKTGIFRAPYPKRLSPATNDTSQFEKLDVLEYRIEHGTIEHKPMSRVTCEGIEVAVFPRATK